MDDLKNSERDLNIPRLKIKMFFLEIKISSGYVGNDQCRKSFYNPKNSTLITNNPHLVD